MSTNIFISIMLITVVAGYDIAHTPDIKVLEAKAVEVLHPIETPKEVLQSVEPTVEDDTPEGYIKTIFGQEEGERLIYMLKTCENKTLKVDATNWNRNGTWDKGLLQINQIHGYTEEQLFDYKFNIRAGYKIYKNAGYSFSPWTCSDVIGEHPFWKR